MRVHDPSLQYEGVPLREWRPEFPDGRLEKIYLHWSAGDYRSVFPAYHFCIARYDELLVFQTSDLRANMRDVRAEPDLPYTQHTRGRNSFAAGLSIMCMRDATPADFGDYPLTDELIDGMCHVAARLAAHYGIPVDAEHIMSHAECARLEGYFGAGDEKLRWDIARLGPSSRPLEPDDALSTGDILRTKIREARS